jgi:pimeloyl-ACP methyl ester carboxylesterase|nr:alpha/beta fold hydrolase [Kofleriaceae bacterium]
MPLLIHAFERLGRRALRKRGVVGREVATGRARLHVYDVRGGGELPPIVVLHGIGSSATAFAPVLARLAKRTSRLIAPDLPGHGFSPELGRRLTVAELLATMTSALDELIGDQPAIVVGNSLGGAIALHYAVRRPQRVRALAMISPAGAHGSDDQWRALTAQFALRTARDGLGFVDKLYAKRPWFGRLLARDIPALMARPCVQDILATAGNADLPRPDDVRALAMPTLLVWGREERLLPAWVLDYFRAHLPAHAVVDQPAGYGHCPHFDDPSGVARRICELAATA